MSTLVEKLEALHSTAKEPICCDACHERWQAYRSGTEAALELVKAELGKHRFDSSTEWVGVLPQDVPHE